MSVQEVNSSVYDLEYKEVCLNEVLYKNPDWPVSFVCVVYHDVHWL